MASPGAFTFEKEALFGKVLIEGYEAASDQISPALPREMFDCYFKHQI
jgi:hypothetical protein